ncbi:uncharacterized protein CLUP02_16006 [Colletotrichum lupini]|uniref:Fungal N-terminal domain-containing protein n=1 Tax=Colletotrichum lupini TaxID=145971 RepID=A0A9Q8T9G4_9PEZI|nr:uncharacterized protein CLUP02_16006 [Colletotrichum lupini]UQC90476.1 hypothetical protein CLUP02_16006 [Colletotrichum lupini]
MADPLSIAGSVAGLLATAVKVSRKNMIQLDYLSIVITHSVLTLSKLESIVCQQDGLRSRMKWALWHEKKILALLPRLESQKSTLTVMITLLNSETQEEASRSQITMLAKVDEILQQNRTLAEQLKLLDNGKSWDTRSVKFMDNASSIISRPVSTQSVIHRSPSAAFRTPESLEGSMIMTLSKRNFELDLGQSRVYKRAQDRETDRSSFTTSNAPTSAWSMLSGLTIGDISTVSAFRLPITLKDINKIAPGSTFSGLLMNYQSMEDQTRSNPFECRDSLSRAPIRDERLAGTLSFKFDESGDVACREPEIQQEGLTTFTTVRVFGNTKKSCLSKRSVNSLLTWIVQQSYKCDDAFLILVGVDSAARVEIQDLANEVSRARPDALCFLVGTSKNRGAPHGDAELGRIAKFFLDLRMKVLYCDVQHPMSVGQLLAQAIIAANRRGLRNLLEAPTSPQLSKVTIE